MDANMQNQLDTEKEDKEPILVFFSGFGAWQVIFDGCEGETSYPATQKGKYQGVFQLSDGDKLTYKYTKSVDDCQYLYPCNHSDDAFKKFYDLWLENDGIKETFDSAKRDAINEGSPECIYYKLTDQFYFEVDTNNKNIFRIISNESSAKTENAISILPQQLTLEQKAKLKKLDDRLSIKDIAALRYKNDETLIQPYAFDIAEACLKGELNFIHDILTHDWRWLSDNPEQGTRLNPLLDYKTAPWPASPEYSESSSCWCLESEWLDGEQPKPAYKHNDDLARLKRFNANNWGSETFNFYRFDYANSGRCYIDKTDFKNWLITQKDHPLPNDCLLADWVNNEPQAKALGNGGEKTQHTNEEQKPWWIPDPKDPIPKHDWYTPARFFARQLIKDDCTLLKKRDLLAVKVVLSFDRVGIKKRGGKLSFDPKTIKKAFSNVIF